MLSEGGGSNGRSTGPSDDSIARSCRGVYGRGVCTEAALNGIAERIVVKQTGHKHEGIVRSDINEASFSRTMGQGIDSFKGGRHLAAVFMARRFGLKM